MEEGEVVVPKPRQGVAVGVFWFKTDNDIEESPVRWRKPPVGMVNKDNVFPNRDSFSDL